MIIHLGIWLSIVGFFAIELIIDSSSTKSEVGWDFAGLGKNMFQQPTYWLTLVLTVTIALLPRFTVKSYRTMFVSSPYDIVRELEVSHTDPYQVGTEEATPREKHNVEMVLRTTSG